MPSARDDADLDRFALARQDEAPLTPAEQRFVEGIRRLMPDYDYEMSGFAKKRRSMNAHDQFALGGQQADPIPALVNEWFRAWDHVENQGGCFDQAESITDPIEAVLLDAEPTTLAGVSALLRFLRPFAIDGTVYVDNRVARLIDAIIAGVERMEGGTP